MVRLRKFLRLSRDERRLVTSAAATLAIVRIALWTIPYASVRRIVSVLARAARRDLRFPKPTAEQISWAVGAASSGIPGGANCLAKALAAEVMLSRFGYDCNLRIGVTKAVSGQLEAHAWLESDGKVLIGQFDLGRYRTLAGR
jgi:Transglutaminase-like superfamily